MAGDDELQDVKIQDNSPPNDKNEDEDNQEHSEPDTTASDTDALIEDSDSSVGRL